MKRKLNPNLVRLWAGPSHVEHWVFLREPKVSGDTKEVGIGPIEIEETPETDEQKEALNRKIKETELALGAHADIEPTVEPHIILTKDCFSFKGPVRLLIYSVKPFA
jgi:hypothetical protein